MEHPDDGSEVFRGWILRTRLKYQFTPRFFLRTIVQWDDFAQDFDVEPLLSYRINPFTAFYLGATSRRHDFPGDGLLRETTRQYFAKVQYLIQV